MRGSKEENMSLLRAPIYFEAPRGRRGEGKGEATRRQVKEVTKEVSPHPSIFAAKHSQLASTWKVLVIAQKSGRKLMQRFWIRDEASEISLVSGSRWNVWARKREIFRLASGKKFFSWGRICEWRWHVVESCFTTISSFDVSRASWAVKFSTFLISFTMVVYDDKAFKFILALRMIPPHYKVGFVFVNLVFASVALHFQPFKDSRCTL